MEAEGYLCSVHGKGSFAAAGAQVDKRRQETLLAQFEKIASELLYLGVPRDTLIQRIQAQGGAET